MQLFNKSLFFGVTHNETPFLYTSTEIRFTTHFIFTLIPF